MTLKKKVKFTPELLIEGPRRSPAVPNQLGTHALFTVSQFSIESNLPNKETKIIDLQSREIRLFSDENSVQDPQWFLDNKILWLKAVDGGITEVWTGNSVGNDKSAYLIGKIQSKIVAPKTHLLENGTVVFAFVAPVSVDGNLLNPETSPKPMSSGREWETLRNRFWDSYLPTYSTTLWYTSIIKDSNSGRYRFCGSPPIDALHDTAYIFPLMQGFGGPVYDISSSGFVLITLNDVDHDYSKHWIEDALFVRVSDFTDPKPAAPILFKSCRKGLALAGAARFSPDGKKMVLLKQRDTNKFVYTHERVFIVDINDPKSIAELPIVNEANEDWDLEPHSAIWSTDGNELYIVAECRGRSALFAVSVPDSVKGEDQSPYPQTIARRLTKSGSVSEVFAFQGSKPGVFVNSTSLIDNSQYTLIYPQSKNHTVILSSATNFGSLFGISSNQVSEFLFEGAWDYKVQCWLIRPSNFDENKTYPCLFWVHGGPISSWPDGWSTRWCAALFAEQGYVVVMPNITGSTGFGEKFSRAIIGDWTIRPTRDLENCWGYVEKNLSYVDADRAIIMGASFGGYMMYWLAGQPLAKKFKAMVCHDGIFSVSSLYAADVAVTVPLELGGAPWENPEINDAQDPSRFTSNWTQPMLIIHSELDYRCTLDAGFAAFTVLKMKGIEARFLSFTDEGHWVLKHQNSLHWNRTVIGWCNKYTGNDGIKLEPPASEKNLRGRSAALSLRTR